MIRPFALAMIIGIIVGTYSSIYIASPTLLLLESRFGGDETAEARPRPKTQGAHPQQQRAKQGKRGRFGSDAAHDFVYDHVIASLAMVEAYGLSREPELREAARRMLER